MLNKSTLFSKVSFLLRLCFVTSLLILIIGALGISTLAQEPSQNDNRPATTPFQETFTNATNARRAAGLPVPQVAIDNRASFARGGPHLTGIDTDDGTMTITATTTIHFANPQQAGYSQWPDLVVEGNVPSEMTGSVTTGNYTELYRTSMEAQFPGIWDTYQFGQEPRNYSYVETLSIPVSESIGQGIGLLSAATSEQILMGFTYTGPNFDYTIDESLEICDPTGILGCATIFSFKAGFELDWSLGLRLPASVNITGPDELEQGQFYNFSSTLNPENWSSSTFSSFGVAAEGGNEFVLRLEFFVGVEGEILGVNLCPSCAVSVSEDRSTSFTMPFGSGSSFPIPPANIDIYEFDLALFYFSVGIGLQPMISSNNITADWRAVPGSDLIGNGTVTYSQPGQATSFGSAQACDVGPTNMAQIEISNFRYNFNQFSIQLSAYLNFELFGYGVWNPTVNIFDFDLSSIFSGIGLAVGDHVQCNATFSCSRTGPDNRIVLSIPVYDHTPPITAIGLAGTAGNNGWFVSNVTVTLNPTDQPNGCGVGVASTEYSFDGISWNNYTGSFLLSDEGITTVYYRSTDLEGNVEATKTQIVKIDKTPPVITGYPTTPPNVYGWWNTDVTVHFEAYDLVSGIDTITPDVTLTMEGAGQSVLGTAYDIAGNSASFLVTDINIDKTNPDITIISPEPIIYANTDSFNIQWIATDSLSGIAVQIGTFDGNVVSNGEFVNLLLVAAGPHNVTVEAIDKADNESNETVNFTVTTDIPGTIAALDYMCEIGWISNHGICNSLRAKLNNALNQMSRGNCHAAANMLNAFLHELDAQYGTHVSPEAHAVLSANIQYILAVMPDCVEDPVDTGGGNGNATGNSTGGGTGTGTGNGNGNGNGNSNGNGNGGAGSSTGGGTGNGNANGNANGNGSANGNGNGNSGN